MTLEAKVIVELFGKLCAANRLPFPVRGSKLVAPNGHGVYIIYSPDGHVMHVGRTVRGKEGLFQRLNNHLQGKSSFTRKQFNRVGALLCGTHSYAFLEVADSRTRCLLESYAIGCLCPIHLGLGDKAG
jgi:hypothetical protein